MFSGIASNIRIGQVNKDTHTNWSERLIFNINLLKAIRQKSARPSQSLVSSSTCV